MYTSFIAQSLIDGSLSNHVVSSSALAALVLSCYAGGQTQTAIVWFTAILYWVTGIHKLNSGFFDPHYSCASLYVSGAFAWVPKSILSFPLVHAIFSKLIHIAPVMAALFENLIPIPLLLSLGWDTENQLVRRCTLFIGAVFHALLALPPSPLSVYPFSAIMVPIYVMLVPDMCGLETRVGDLILRNGIAQICLVGIIAAAAQWGPRLLFQEDDLFEYPNYGLWGVSVVWNCVFWVLIILSVIVGPIRGQPRRTTIRSSGCGWITILILISLAGFGLTPYIGLRNYPALAMFANLRTEGTKPNHWIGGIDLFQYQRDYVIVHETNIESIMKMQINLGELFPVKLKDTNDMFGLSNEFYICPPKWPFDRPSYKFRTFNVPFIELRRRLTSVNWADVPQGYVKYTRVRPDGSKLDEFFRSEKLEASWHLLQPLSWFERYFVKFRTFSDEYSPCRH